MTRCTHNDLYCAHRPRIRLTMSHGYQIEDHDGNLHSVNGARGCFYESAKCLWANDDF